MNASQTDAVSTANAYLNNACLPSYDAPACALDNALELIRLMRANRAHGFEHDPREARAAQLVRDLRGA